MTTRKRYWDIQRRCEHLTRDTNMKVFPVDTTELVFEKIEKHSYQQKQEAAKENNLCKKAY